VIRAASASEADVLVTRMLMRMLSLAGSVFSAQFWRAKWAMWRARWFDYRYGTDTVIRMPVEAMSNAPTSLKAHAVHYEPSAMPKLYRALNVIRSHLSDSFSAYSLIDFGSGKGLVTMIASDFRFKHIYGVEMTPQLHEIAERNVKKFLAKNPRATPIDLRCMDALEFEFPAGNLVAYLYNPFGAALMERMVRKLLDNSDTQREILVVYLNPVHRELFDCEGRFSMLHDDGALCVYRLVRTGATS
jgi:predicted RNA methylase